MVMDRLGIKMAGDIQDGGVLLLYSLGGVGKDAVSF
jgi:hypothetical protein